MAHSSAPMPTIEEEPENLEEKENPPTEPGKKVVTECPCYRRAVESYRQQLVDQVDEKKKRKDLQERLDAEQLKPAMPEVLSKDLQKKIDAMMKSIAPHQDVYPDAPKPGQVAVPSGGLAKCMCSPDCKKELPQPAYHIIDAKKEEDKRWNINCITQSEWCAMMQGTRIVRKK